MHACMRSPAVYVYLCCTSFEELHHTINVMGARVCMQCQRNRVDVHVGTLVCSQLGCRAVLYDWDQANTYGYKYLRRQGNPPAVRYLISPLGNWLAAITAWTKLGAPQRSVEGRDAAWDAARGGQRCHSSQDRHT